ncbi:MAG: hypothetical protein NTV60_03035 [Candidatus Kaiserbacteria bacterium]|nr:hypothetical protein [Candidatus Kaiserbacteria bacterium]
MKPNTIILIVLTVLIAGGAYWYFATQSGNDAPLTSAISDNAPKTQFQALVSELQSISFNTAIFSDPKFTSLVDLKVPVTAEPSGRLDPFASIQDAAAQ